jgi:Tol biopolymer transport system component
LVLGILILIILGVVFVSGCVQQEGDGADGQNGNGDDVIMPADLTQITFFEGEGMTADPDWSPDGTQIVFGRQTGTDPEDERGLYIINSDGTGLTEIGPEDVFDPSWSPVDNRILCYGGENSELYVIDLDENVTEKITLAEHAMYPAWSPNGTKIVYYVYDDTNAPLPLYDPQCDGTGISISIWIMNSDGTGKTQLTTDEDGHCSDPSFSPDGTEILYNKGFMHPGVPFLVRSESEIWVMNSNGSDKHAIYTSEDSKFYLHQRAWSKNNEIMFEKIQWQKAPQIWVMNSDGTNPRAVIVPEESMDAVLYGDIAWDNTGTKIVTTKWRSASEETPDIFVDSNVVTFSLGE